MSMRKGLWMVAVAASVLVGGCERADRAPETTEGAQSAQAERMPDDRVATYVQARFQRDDALRANDIDVSVSDGVVTLGGVVESETTREHAIDVARQVEGVRSVNDQLRVAQPGADARSAIGEPAQPGDVPERASAERERMPAWITTKIQAQYFTSADVRPWNVDVSTTSDGVVTLAGEVSDARAKSEAERIARETEGVTRVVNNIRVGDEAAAGERETRSEPEEAGIVDRPDAWITAKIQAKYFMDPDVKAREINVNTSGGVVTLTGEVESEAERRQAIALARNTEGVQTVTDKLVVRQQDENAAGTGRTARESVSDTATAIDDTWITMKVQSKFFLEQGVKARDIDVDTRRGVVTLNGAVRSQEEKETALAIARETDGVARVVDELRVERPTER